MAQQDSQTYPINPDWKQYFIGYVVSILAIPLFGIGLIALYFVRKKHRQITYKITNTQITRIDARYEHKVDLIDIKSIDLERTWLQKQLGIGTLVLQTSASSMLLEGLEEPEKLRELLEQAIETEQKRREEQQKTKTREPKYDAGDMDRLEYLTGLWQQGLLSDEDYKKERKQFE